MVRNYKRSTIDRWSKEDLLEALKQIKDGTLRVNEASRLYNISRATLYRQYTRFINNGSVEDPEQFHKCGGSPILSKVEERVFVDTILTLRAQGNRVSSAEVKRICFEYCEVNGIPNQFNPIKRMASDDWYYGFLKRHPLVRIKGEGKKVAVNEAPDAKDNVVDELIGIVESGKKEAAPAAPKLIPPDAPAPAEGKLKKPLKRLGQVKPRAAKKPQENPMDEQDQETELIVEKEVVVEAESGQERMEEDKGEEDLDDTEVGMSSHEDEKEEDDDVLGEEEEEMLEEEEYNSDDDEDVEEEEEGCAMEDIKEEEEEEGGAMADIKEEEEGGAMADIKEESGDEEE